MWLFYSNEIKCFVLGYLQFLFFNVKFSYPGTVILGIKLHSFNSYIRSMSSLYSMVLGKFSFWDIRSASS